MLGTVKKLSKKIVEVQNVASVATPQAKLPGVRRQREPRGMLSRIVLDGQSSAASPQARALAVQNEKTHLKKLQVSAVLVVSLDSG